MQKDTLYINSAVKAKIKGKYLVDKQKLFRLAEQKSVSEVYKLLNENKYDIPSDENIGSDKVLSDERKKTLNFLKSIIDDREFIDLILIENDYYNIKLYLKQILSEENIDKSMFSNEGTIPADALISELSEEKKSRLNGYMFNSYKKAKEEYLENKNAQIIDFFIDYYLYKNQIEISKNFGCLFITDYLRTRIDLINLKILLRIKRLTDNPILYKKALLDGGKIDVKTLENLLISDADVLYGKFKNIYGQIIGNAISDYFESKDLTKLSSDLDAFLVDMLKKVRYKAFGPEVIFSYYKAKEAEIGALRVILNGIENGLEADVIKERLREFYV